MKLRGDAQGPRALVAEVIAGELGRRLGLPVPPAALRAIPYAILPMGDARFSYLSTAARRMRGHRAIDAQAVVRRRGAVPYSSGAF